MGNLLLVVDWKRAIEHNQLQPEERFGKQVQSLTAQYTHYSLGTQPLIDVEYDQYISYQTNC